MEYYLKNTEEVLRELRSSPEGLSASRSEELLNENGPNRLADAKKKTLLQRLAEQILNPMIIVLIVAAVISGAMGELMDMAVILVVVLLNSILGVVQESKSEKAIEALQAMTSSRSKVRRGGEVLTVESRDLVPGDIVLLEAGDSVPADLRILESASLKTDEAPLTGESVPVDKVSDEIASQPGIAVPLGDRVDMAYMGTTVSYGRGVGVVTATGMKTEMGKIADTLANASEEETPLQKKLSQLSKVLSFAVLAVCVFVFVFSLLRGRNYSADAVLNTFLLAISLAVAAIPEGLAAVVTIVLSLGVSNMSKRSAIIRKLTAVETLGCTEIVCTDKTGTLTQNRMTVTDTFGDPRSLARAMALCSDAQVTSGGETVGEPTECALVAHALKLGLEKGSLEAEYPRMGEAPFDSSRKMMTTVHALPDGGCLQVTKGAPDVVLKRCAKMEQDGKVLPLTDELRETIAAENHRMAGNALRVLAAAVKPLEHLPESYEPERLETGLTFIGLTGMIDPVRPEVGAAVQRCREAGIRPVMITGDHKDTAAAIAKELGIVRSAEEVVTGSELDDLSDEELEQRVSRYGVYARVQPEHKVRIVQAWKRDGKVTAMTGDGVNDAPALKTADIGVGMGITGTDVTKNAADMVLADDNFSTIVSAVEEGRRIYDNIRKSIQFLLSSNLSEVISIFLATLFGFVLFRPIHILWINLITDSLPAVALGMEKSEPGIMNRPARPREESLFSGGVGFDVIYQGIATALLTLWAYFVGAETSHDTGMTMAFLAMSMCEIFHSYNMRSQRRSIFTLPTHNLVLWGAMLLSLLLTAAMIYVPALSTAFSLETLSAAHYFTALGIALLIIPIVEAVKAVERSLSGKTS